MHPDFFNEMKFLKHCHFPQTIDLEKVFQSSIIKAGICLLKNSKAKFKVDQSFEQSKGRGVIFWMQDISHFSGRHKIISSVLTMLILFFLEGNLHCTRYYNLVLKLLMHKHISCVRRYYVGLCNCINLIKN